MLALEDQASSRRLKRLCRQRTILCPYSWPRFFPHRLDGSWGARRRAAAAFWILVSAPMLGGTRARLAPPGTPRGPGAPRLRVRLWSVPLLSREETRLRERGSGDCSAPQADRGRGQRWAAGGQKWPWATLGWSAQGPRAPWSGSLWEAGAAVFSPFCQERIVAQKDTINPPEVTQLSGVRVCI